MFTNEMKQRRFICEMGEAKDGHHYIVHVFRTESENGALAGMVTYEFYLTDSNPDHDLLLGIGRKAFAPGEYSSEKEMYPEIEEEIKADLIDGIRRFESIMESHFS